MNPFYEQFYNLLQQQAPFVCVTLVHTIGSAPQEPGAKMLVSKEGLYYGTVGGGKVEKRAIEEAITMLNNPNPVSSLYREWNLSTDIGMTCGGSVKFYFELMNANTWPIVLFGAGHVAQSLINILIQLDCHITCIDPRWEWLAKLPDSPKLTKIQLSDMPGYVPQIPPQAFVILMTMGHSTDKPILLEILKRETFPYLGVIGSRAKAVQLKKDVIAAGLPEHLQQAFHCPIGLPIGNNHPQEIAISVAAQLLQARDRSNSIFS
jgi:xanthine dehydrogenase accessory factor